MAEGDDGMSSVDEQLDLWVSGRSVHDTEADQCCPDFSCCQPTLLAPQHEREAFARLSQEDRMPILGTFLARAFQFGVELMGSDKKIYIAGSTPEHEA